MEIRFGLITFYQCFECCQKGFALLHNIQGKGERNDLWIQYHLHKYMCNKCVKRIDNSGPFKSQYSYRPTVKPFWAWWACKVRKQLETG